MIVSPETLTQSSKTPVCPIAFWVDLGFRPDLAMPRLPGLETLRELTTVDWTVLTIILTAAIEKPQIVEALQLGARGVVMKESATALMLKSIRSVMDGEFWVGRESVSSPRRGRIVPGVSQLMAG